jgi:hypothetical protein
MLYSLRKSVSATATPEALATSRTIAGWVTIQASVDNSAPIYAGGIADTTPPTPTTPAVKNSVDNVGLYVGHRLAPGDFCNFREMGGPAYLDLQYIYIAVDSAGDSVVVNYGRR